MALGRYKQITRKIDKETNNRVYNTTMYPEIQARNTDSVIIVKEGKARLDSLAYQYYGSTTLWWVISQANKLGGDTMYAPVGQKIRIPHHIEEILRDMDYLNSRR
tara:strand:- start:7617 stop:7931 length:315 start_codon:yes stop_codon:yes gene_type:complete